MSATRFLIAADAIASGCSESEVYANVARAAFGDQTAAMFLADPNDPFAALTRDEVVTGLCFAAAAAE